MLPLSIVGDTMDVRPEIENAASPARDEALVVNRQIESNVLTIVISRNEPLGVVPKSSSDALVSSVVPEKLLSVPLSDQLSVGRTRKPDTLSPLVDRSCVVLGPAAAVVLTRH